MLRIVLKQRVKFGQNWVQSRRITKLSCLSPNSILWWFVDSFKTFLWFSPKFLNLSRTFSKFQGKKKKFRGKEIKSRGTKLGKYRIKSRRYAVSSSQKHVFVNKKIVLFRVCSMIYDFQPLWESHISQQLFLSSKSRVKWKDRNCENIFLELQSFVAVCWWKVVVHTRMDYWGFTKKNYCGLSRCFSKKRSMAR